MEYLLIGGNHDGKRVDVDRGLQYVRMANTTTLAEVPGFDSLPELVDYEFEVYRKELFRGKEKEFFIFRYIEISVDEMVEKLINGYKPEEDKEG